MNGKKEKYGILKLVIHYAVILVLAVLTVFGYLKRQQIADYFAQDFSSSELINGFLHIMPKIIITFEIIVLGIVVNLVISSIAKLGFGFTDKGKTLVNIINSLIKWVIIIGAVLWILSVWGVDTTTLLASAGILALVIGLGAQSLISDIIAGIFMVLEGEYLVGDIVVIDGWRGKIKSIGIRTTQLEDIGGNIKIINNSEIKTVINQTKKQSLAKCSVRVDGDLLLSNVEKLFNENLARIKESIPAITGEISYKGVTDINDLSMELLFVADCYEEDLYQVQRDLTRAFRLLLEENNLSNFAPQAIEDKTSKRNKN